MRTLTVNEAQEVGGGVVFALPVVKVAAGAVIAGGLILAKYLTEAEALKTAADLCREGSDASVKTKEVALTCTAKKPQAQQKPERPAGLRPPGMPQSPAPAAPPAPRPAAAGASPPPCPAASCALRTAMLRSRCSSDATGRL